MPPFKPEPFEISPETKPQTINSPPLIIKSEPTEFLPDNKSEPIDYIPPTKRPKTLTSNSPSSKGKSKIIKEEQQQDHDTDTEFDSSFQLDTCGVCLLEQGMSHRGFIDSCEHYFCFVCIMEWAKVESRCPVCKRRFSTIRRPPKDGLFVSERIVNVPVRNQIHYFNGNATIGPPDLYSQVKCSVCSTSTDDELLLLCDLCDYAAHTYCVGLGATVPEGDWFCKDCTLSRDEHAKVENNSKNNNDNSCPLGSNEVRFARSDVSIHDIVRETYTREPRTSSVPASVDQSEPVAEQSNTQSTVDRSNTSNARTLQRCVNVNSHIRVLRENWEGYKRGSLNFSVKEGQEKSTSQKHSNSDVSVDKAWKMMDIATKDLGKKSGNKSLSKFPIKNVRLVNEASEVKPNNRYFQGLKINDSVGTSINKPMKQNYVEREIASSRQINASNVIGSTDINCSKKEQNWNIKKDPQVDGNIIEVENAKTEIQSLVKLNLKLLSRDKKLDVDVFKEVARHSTHSIMAACGIQPLKARYRSFERLVCNHNETNKRAISTLMPTSCRECFFVFVKDVVTAIAFDRTGSCKV